MDSREFVEKLKRHAIDDTVENMMRSLKSPRKLSNPVTLTVPDPYGISARIVALDLKRETRSKWFDGLGEDGREIVRNLLEECAELTAFGFTTFIDGVGGDTDGVFEIVEVVDDERRVLNPENSDMLHDLLSDVCESDREHRKAVEDKE